MLQLVSGIQIAGIAIAFSAIISILRRKQTDYGIMLLMEMICCAVAMMGYLFTLHATGLKELLLSCKFSYMGKCFSSGFALLFITKYYSVKVPKFVFPVIFAIDFAVFAVIMTCDKHQYFYANIKMESNGYFMVAHSDKTPIYVGYMAFMLLTLVWFEVICIQNWWRNKYDKNKMLCVSLFFAGLLPFAGLLLFLAGVTGGYDTTPLGIFLSSLFILIAVQKLGLLDAVLVAKETVIETIEECIFVVDKEYQLLYQNQMARRLFDDHAIAYVRQIFNSKDQELDIQGRSYEVRIMDIQQNGVLYGHMAWIFDITDLKKNAQRMMELKEEAERATRAKSEFLANMSHEIRTPMNAIIGMTEMILRGELDAERRDYAYQIKSAGNSLLTIINDILDFSKIESGKMEIIEDEYELMSLIHDVNSIIQTRIGDKSLRYIVNINETIPHRLYGDANRIKQMVINLANNAVKFTANGSVTLTVDYEMDGNSALNLMVRVKDTGIGIKKEDLEKIFESFGQADSYRNRQIEGTGLGLAITRNLAHLMGGEIYVRSVYNTGSEFSFIIPQKIVDKTPCSNVDPEEMRRKEESQYTHFTACDARILVVDDNHVNLLVAEGLLQPFQMQVDLADSGIKAIEMVQKNSYDLVFMDHMMPGMDGIETVRAIRALPGDYASLPMVAFSANAVNGAREKLIGKGMDDFVAKPITLEELVRVLLKWLPKEKIKTTERS